MALARETEVHSDRVRGAGELLGGNGGQGGAVAREPREVQEAKRAESQDAREAKEGRQAKETPKVCQKHVPSAKKCVKNTYP